MAASCATGTNVATNDDFSPPAIPEIENGFALRDRYNLPKFIGGPAIFVDSVAVHHIQNEASTIVWMDSSGNWHKSQVIERGPGILQSVERKLTANTESTLPLIQSQALEDLLRDPDLYIEETLRSGDIGIGAPNHVMAIVTPFGRTTVRWNGRLLGKKGEVADIVLGSD